MDSSVCGGISVLNFDGTLKNQPLLRQYPAEWIDFSDLRGCYGYCSGQSLRQIQQRLSARKYRCITLIGNGNHHYVTYVLLSEIRQPFSLLLFDHHTDLALRGHDPLISCGSWVSVALETLTLLKRVVIVGAQPAGGEQISEIPDKVTIIPEQEASRLPTAAVVRMICAALPDLPLYISVDKDVLNRENAITNWDQGSMTLPQLLDVIRALKQIFPIVGVDICGELPLPPHAFPTAEQVRQLKKNEMANKAIVDVLLAG